MLVGTGAGAMFTVYDCVDELPPFMTRMANVEVPAVVGVPAMVVVLPVLELFRNNPAGKVPEKRFQVNVPVAVVDAVNVCAYELLAVPFGNITGIMVMAAGSVLVAGGGVTMPGTTTVATLLNVACTLPSWFKTTICRV